MLSAAFRTDPVFPNSEEIYSVRRSHVTSGRRVVESMFTDADDGREAEDDSAARRASAASFLFLSRTSKGTRSASSSASSRSSILSLEKSEKPLPYYSSAA